MVLSETRDLTADANDITADANAVDCFFSRYHYSRHHTHTLPPTIFRDFHLIIHFCHETRSRIRCPWERTRSCESRAATWIQRGR